MKTIGTIPRDTDNEIRISIGEFQKIDVVDIRLHNNDKPTKKGIRLNLEEIKVLQEILEKVKQWE